MGKIWLTAGGDKSASNQLDSLKVLVRRFRSEVVGKVSRRLLCFGLSCILAE